MARSNFLWHLFPVEVTVRRLSWKATFGLGVINIGLVLLLTVTGLLLALFYQPAPEHAYASIWDIDQVVPFGRLLRSVHRWSTHFLIIGTTLHLARVWAMGAYRGRPRNWLYGLGLGAGVLGLSLTGYLLVWDQTAYWAVRIVAEIVALVPWVGGRLADVVVGGREVGSATLLRFYAWHVLWLPLLGAMLLVLHIWRVRIDSRARPVAGAGETVASQPHLTWRVAALLLGTAALLMLVSMLVPAVISAPASFSRPENPAKAPWYFLSFQEAVSYSALWGATLFPLLVGAVTALLPWLDRAEPGSEAGASVEHPVRLAALSIGTTLLVLGLVEWLFLSAAAQRFWEGRPRYAQDILNPISVMAIWMAMGFVGLRLWGRNRREAFLFVGLAMAVLLVGLTVLGAARTVDWQLPFGPGSAR